MSDFRLQIINKTNGKVHQWWEPREATDIDLVESLCEALKARGGVGLFSTEAAVLGAIREAFPKVVMDLKKQVRPGARK